MSTPILSAYTTLTGVVEPSDLGRNLLRGTRFVTLDDITEGGITYRSIHSHKDGMETVVDGIDGNKGYQFTTGSDEKDVYRGVFFIAAVNKGEQYTVSAWVKGTAGNTMCMEFVNNNGTERKNSDGTSGTYQSSSTTLTDSWKKITHTFSVDSLNAGYVECNFFTNEPGTFTICEPKLERGDAATAFCLNEFDLKGASGKNNFLHVAWCNNIDSSTQKPSDSEPIYLSKDTQGAAYDYMGTWVSETEETTETEARELATWVYVRGEKGDTPTVAKLRVDYSACHFSRTSNTWDHDSVTVTIVIMDGSKITIPAYGDTSRYYWRLSTDSEDTMRSSNMGFSASLNASSITVNLYKTGGDSNVPLDTITVPMVFDGANGDGTPATVYTIEPVGNINAYGTLTDTNKISVEIVGDVKAFKTTGDSKEPYYSQPQSWSLSIGGVDHVGTSTFNNNAGNNIISFNFSNNYDLSNVPGSAVITLFSDSSLSNQLASLIVPISLNPGAIQDINTKLGTIQSTTTSMQKDMNGMKGSIETIKQGQGEINLKVQDLQNGGIDTSKPHTSSQVDFTTLSENNFYPVLIQQKDGRGVRHTFEVSRDLNADYGTPSYGTHPSAGFSFRIVFTDVMSEWHGFNRDLRIETVSEKYTSGNDTACICPRIDQYEFKSIEIVWLRGGSKYDVMVDNADACISGIWPVMMQMEGNSLCEPDAVRLANNTWTTVQVNAQGSTRDLSWSLLQSDDKGTTFYVQTTDDFLYRFGNIAAGQTVCIVGQPTDSKQWFVLSWRITSVIGTKIYVDISSFGRAWHTQNPLGIYMNNAIGYISRNNWLDKSGWEQAQFETSKSLYASEVHKAWNNTVLLYVGKENQSTNGVYRDRAVLEFVNSFNKNSDGESGTVSFSSDTYFDISPLYGTDGRKNVKTDLLATGIDIKSHKITATTDNFEIRNNSGTLTFSIDEDGNIVGVGNASFKGSVTAKTFTLSSDKFYVDNNGKFKLKMTNFSVKEDGTITAKGGSVSFFNFDSAGMYSGNIEQDGKIYSGLGMSMNNLSVSGNNNRRISSVFLGNGTIDSRFTNSDNRTVYRVGSTIEGSTFYNYIKLERIGSGSFSFENSPEHAALGIETQGDFCLAALGGPSYFEGLCFPSASGSSSMTADGKRTMYLFSGGDFYMPSNPPDGLEIKVIQTGSKITFHDGGHKFRNGLSYSDTFTSDTRGQWNFFYFDGSNWHWNYMNK